MDDRQRGSEWTIVFALGLIALGVWFLLGNLLGPWWHAAMFYASRVLWPLSLIVFGVLLLIMSNRGKMASTAGRRLYRSRTDRRVSGVLGGIADYLGLDPTLVRAVYIVLAIVTGFGPAIALYIVAAIIIHEEPIGASVPYTSPPGVPPVPPVPPAPPHDEPAQS